MKKMKNNIKRILATLCCVTLLVTGLSVSGWMKDTALAGDVRGTISIATGDVGYANSFGHINVAYTGMPSDYGRGIDFLDKEFVNKYVTFGGGMTDDDLFDSKNIFYLATDNIVQFNWTGRTNLFEKGWTFTIAQGAKLPYMTSTEEKAYVQLDAEYTYEVVSGREGYECIFRITKQKVETFSLNAEALIGTGVADGTGTLFHMSGSNLKDYRTIYAPMQGEEEYRDYISFGGVAFDKWEQKGLRFRYVLDGGTKCIQIESWGSLRNELSTGDQIVFYKGMPIYYTGIDGTEYKAELDGTYVYECIGSNADHNQLFEGIKIDENHHKYGINTIRYGTAVQGDETYINVTFDEASADSIRTSGYISADILEDLVVEKYVDIAGYSLKKARNMGMKIRFIPTANTLQFAFGTELLSKLKIGDRIILKKGMPVIYNNGGKLDSAVLNNEYMLTVASKDSSGMQFTCGLSEPYSLSLQTGERVEEAGSYYFDIRFAGEMFGDSKKQFEGDFTEQQMLFEQYFEVSGKSAAELLADGWVLRRYNLPGVYVGLRFYCPSGKFDLASGDYVMIKQGFPITYTTTSGQEKTVYADDDYGYLYNGSGFVYDNHIQAGDGNNDEEESTDVDQFGLDTPLVSTYTEGALHVADIPVTGTPFVYKNYLYQMLDATNLDFSACANSDKVQNGLTAQITLASADLQVLQVKLTDDAVSALQVGDQIVLKKNTPFAYNPEKADAIAKLDHKYVLRVTEKQGKEVCFQVELTGTYSFAEVFYHAESYMDVRFASNQDLSDAVNFEGTPIDDAYMKEYLEIAEHTYADLKEQGYTMASYSVPAFRGVRINFNTFDLTAGTVLLLKKGLPLSYTTTEGKKKTVYLDKTYGYTKNEQTAFVYDPNLTEIKETEEIAIGLADEAGSYKEGDGSERFNLNLAGGAIATSQYVQINLLDAAKTRDMVKVEGFTTEQLLTAGAQILFIPSAGVFQFAPGSLNWKDVSKITLEKGLAISYYDNGPKKAVLDDTYVYKVKKENNRYVMTRVQDYKVTITVDGVEKLSGKYKVGTKLDLAQYANPSKGKIMTIKMNGESIQEKTLVVSGHADVVIENRSDLCVVVFKDGKETIVVKEYGLHEKNIKIPFAPDRNGYDDSWEEFELVNDVITVQAIHTKRQTEPIVKIDGAVAEPEIEKTPENDDASDDVTSPQTGDMAKGGAWMLLMIVAMITIAEVLPSKKRKTVQK